MGGQGCFGKPDICLFINNNLLISIDCLFPVFYKEDGGGRVCDGHGKPLCIRYNPGYLCTFRGSYLGFTELFMIWFAFASSLSSHFFRWVFEKYMALDEEKANSMEEKIEKL